MAITRKQLRYLTNCAKAGYRLLLIGANDMPTSLWAGLGNRSGLHGYADTVTREKWEKSGKGLVKKLLALEAGAEVKIHVFKNKTRDRGSWVPVDKVTVSSDEAPACYHLESDSRGESCATCGAEMYESISPIM